MEIRIYIEGAPKNSDAEGRAQFRQGFQEFFKEIRNKAWQKRIKIEVTVCGGRDSTLNDFRKALRSHPQAFNILLVDSETAVAYQSPDFAPRQHLAQRDQWDMKGITDEQCHLMAQTMETWLICDIPNLRKFYGQGFHEKPIPKTQDVEMIDKERLNEALKRATQNSTAKAYHKMRHGPKLLKALNSAKVRKAAAHCERLFATIETKIASA